MSLNFRSLPEFDNHEQVVYLNDKDSGLRGFIAIHNTSLGPALGGTRVFEYQDDREALADALRLSRAMTYKCAIASLPFGGGKAVIIAKHDSADFQKKLKPYALAVASLKGKFYTGEDVGLTETDVQQLLKFSPYFIGKTGQAGDPSNFAALSTFNAILVAFKFKYGTSDLSGRTFAIKGVGKCGSELVRMLSRAGAKIFISDILKEKTRALEQRFPDNISTQAPERIHKLDVDAFCPCAMGNDVTTKNLSEIHAQLIVGAANNQLESAEIGDELYKKGILHIPDYVANGGGLLDVADELLPGGYDKRRVLRNIEKLNATLDRVLQQSQVQGISPDRVADKMSEEIFKKKVKIPSLAEI